MDKYIINNEELTPREMKNKILELQAENAQLKSQLDEAMELIELAREKMEDGHLCTYCISECVDKGLNENECELTYQCGCFKWQHQYRYEKLKSEVEQNG